MEYILPYLISFTGRNPILRNVCSSWRQMISINDKHIIEGIRRKYVMDTIYASIHIALEQNDIDTIRKILHEYSKMILISWDHLIDVIPSIEMCNLIEPFLINIDKIRSRKRAINHIKNGPSFIKGKERSNSTYIGNMEYDRYSAIFDMVSILKLDLYEIYPEYRDEILQDPKHILAANGRILNDMIENSIYMENVLLQVKDISMKILDQILKGNTNPDIRRLALSYGMNHHMIDIVGYHIRKNEMESIGFKDI